MNITEKVLNRFGTELVAEMVTEKFMLSLFKNQILYVYVLRHTIIDMKMVLEITNFLGDEHDKTHYNIVEFEPFSESVTESRKWAAGQTNERSSFADAFVVNNLAHKILMDSYLKQSKPIFPTAIFNTTEQAFDWIEMIMNERI